MSLRVRGAGHLLGGPVSTVGNTSPTLSHDCMLTEDTFQSINGPVAAGRQRASGLCFADRRIQSLLHGLGSCPTASVAPTCAITSPSFQDATPNRSRKAPSRISFDTEIPCTDFAPQSATQVGGDLCHKS